MGFAKEECPQDEKILLYLLYLEMDKSRKE